MQGKEIKCKRRKRLRLFCFLWHEQLLQNLRAPLASAPMRDCKRKKEDFLVVHKAVPSDRNWAEEGTSLHCPQLCSLCSTTPQCICVLAATRCKLNEYLPCTDLYQVKNHRNSDLICLCNKWFVYTELDALLQLLEISLNHKTLVRPCLGKAETASLPQPSLY